MNDLERGGALHDRGRRAHGVIRRARALVKRHEARGEDRGHPHGRFEGRKKGRRRRRVAPAPVRRYRKEVLERAVEHECPTRGGKQVVRHEVRLDERSRAAAAATAFCGVRLLFLMSFSGCASDGNGGKID